MDPNRYINDRKPKSVNIPERRPAPVVNSSVKPPVPPVNKAAAPVRKAPQRTARTGKLCISGKRFFGQILIDHWVIRINGEQKEVPFGRNKLSLELPAGVYLVTAYTPYLGMHCMRVTADIEVRPGSVTNISYQTVFDIFKNGIMRHNIAAS
ncbi:MAG: hypothetical protein ACI4JN_12385 [Ruminococcus sp.]